MRHFMKTQTGSKPDGVKFGKQRRACLVILILSLSFLFCLYVLFGFQGYDPTTFGTLTRDARTPLAGSKTEEESGPEICLVYDRPPRTGSSTAGRAFQECWDGLYFEIVNKKRLSDDADTVKTLVKSGPFVAATSYHFIITADDLVNLTTRCKNLFYITSTRALRERIISTALGSVEKHTFTFADNVTLREDEIPVAMSIANRRAEALERKLESYPYRNTEERITPDYIIRYQNFSEDLAAILQAFGCSGSFESVNIHILDDNKSEPSEKSDQNELGNSANKRLQDMQFNLTQNDNRHTEMSKLAELVNSRGLVKAQRLTALRQSMQLY